MRHPNPLLVLTLSLALAACGDDGTSSSNMGDDSGTSDTGDGDTTAEPDSETDVMEPDTEPDAAEPDATEDTAEPDATEDTAEPDATEDTAEPDATEDAGADTEPDAEPDIPAPGDFCEDPAAGSGTTVTPTPAGETSFTTELVECSLSPTEVAACYGAAHESSITITAETIEITSNAIPNHDAGIFPNGGNPNVISAQDLTWSIPLVPNRDGTSEELRTIGVALNGIKMEPNTAEVYSGGQWRYEALTFLGRLGSDTEPFPDGIVSLGADCNFAHVQPTGEYHYHGNPTALMPESPSHTQVGWAADGYPIYGRYGFENTDGTGDLVELAGGYRIVAGSRESLGAGDSTPPGDYDGTFVQDWEFSGALGDLDECNGREETNTIDGRDYDYAYYLTHSYPFMPRCVWGEPGEGFGGGGGPPDDGGDGPTSCSDNSDCVGECFDGATGCVCVNSPADGQICVASCSDNSDCDDGFECGGPDSDICVPVGGPGGGGPP
ncbi:MAG: hypothetical protein ACJAYU_002602 [Bradymonadia bacterium]|jgi:hypothetical protein